MTTTRTHRPETQSYRRGRLQAALLLGAGLAGTLSCEAAGMSDTGSSPAPPPVATTVTVNPVGVEWDGEGPTQLSPEVLYQDGQATGGDSANVLGEFPINEFLIGAAGGLLGSLVTLIGGLLRDGVRRRRARTADAYADFFSAAAGHLFGSDDPRGRSAESLARIGIYGSNRTIRSLVRALKLTENPQPPEDAQRLAKAMIAMRRDSGRWRPKGPNVGILVTGTVEKKGKRTN